MSTLTVLCGIPGAGKSTYAATHYHPDTILSLDMARTIGPDLAFAQVANTTRTRLADDLDTVIDGCATRTSHRRLWLNIARHYHATTNLVMLPIDPATATHRNTTRPTTDRIPQHHLNRYHHAYAVTTILVPTEDWDTITTITP